ncbi:MAG: hypothetical protein QN172_07205 [Armatimonadota bacterium]|nr:hypothetical protein [Armatimonadota bacterium]MDR7440020.1 hypothetical protein [Armatimonadota bacterium]MDR7568632.1 hypothetical protein [Armatimonadota bacterium]MDR7602232.1 hypothetical protein [Armatimonadota bacterium]
MNRPLWLVALGLGILLASWIFLFLTTLRMIPPSLLSLAAYAASLVGFLFGVLGLAEYVRTRRLL